MAEASAGGMVLSERKGAVLILTLNRPDKSNSLHPDLVSALSALLTEASKDRELSVVILTGSGRSFCAGLDLDLLLKWSAEEKLGYLETATSLFRQVWTLPQPVIAAVNGAAIAGGFDLAAFCDIRLASKEAIFGQAEINIGLTQIVHPLYKLIGLGRAKELAMTGMNIDAAEAYRIGLVNHVYEPADLMPRALELAAVLAAKPRSTLFETKRLTRELIDLDTERAFEVMSRAFVSCIHSEDHTARVAEVHSRIKRRSS